ncbi:MAG: hypothetical protein ACRCSU_07865 [Paracoccaceae bacterium]
MAAKTINVLTGEVVTEPDPPTIAAVVQVPVLTGVQFIAALRLNGLYDAALAAIGGMSDPDKTVFLTAFERATSFSRNDPKILALASVLGLSSNDVDAMWAQAAAL